MTRLQKLYQMFSKADYESDVEKRERVAKIIRRFYQKSLKAHSASMQLEELWEATPCWNAE